MAERLALMVAILLVSSTVLAPLLVASAASTAAATSASCESIEHTALRTADAVQAFNESGEAVSKVSNTEVRVRETTGFVNLDASNPNGYCVAFTVEISPEIVSAADLGEVKSNNETTSASWRAAQNLSSGDVYTRVTFTLGPGEDATFAPSTVRVKSLSWTGTAKSKSTGLKDRLSGLFGSDKLSEREYTIEPTSNSSRITVPLSSSSGEEVEDWMATYTYDGETRPVDQDARAPVYYTESGSSVTFHFSDEAVRNGARADFTAEPTFVDRTSHSARSWWSGVGEISDWLPGAIVPRGRLA